MAATPVPEISTGSTIIFATLYFGKITSMSYSGATRPSVDITNFGTSTQREFMPGDLYDPGQLSVTAHFDATQLPPIGDAAETITINFPTIATGSAVWEGTGFMIDASWEAPLEDVMVGTFTLKFDGDTDLAFSTHA